MAVNLTELHIAGKANYRVVTFGSGHSYVEVSDGDNLHGNLDKLIKLSTVPDWQPHVRGGKRYIPTYAYDRLIVAGLGCHLAPSEDVA